jgi:uncharacterized membrane protein
MQATTDNQFAWIALIIIGLLCVFIVGMVLKMWKSEWKPGSEFKNRHGIKDN